MDPVTLSFNRAELLSVLQEGRVDALPIESDKQVQQLLQQVAEQLQAEDDWQKRISAMHMLQALAWGDLAHHSGIISLLRGLGDKLASQVADLRSQVCKECCKTVAILAYQLGPVFSPVVDLLWGKLARLVSIKVQVMAKAADSCIRVILLSCPDQRIFAHVLEGCDSKVVSLRRLSLEYLCIVAATWKKELIDKNSASFKGVFLSGLRDADNNTRKLSRLLFRFARDNELLTKCTQSVLDEQDSTVQRLLQSENLNVELLALKNLSLNSVNSIDELAIPQFGTISKPADIGMPEKHVNSSTVPLDSTIEFQKSNVDVVRLAERRLSVTGPKRLIVGAPVNGSTSIAEPISKLPSATRLLSGSVRLASESNDSNDYHQTESVKPSTRSSTMLANGPRRVLREENIPKIEPEATTAVGIAAMGEDAKVIKKKVGLNNNKTVPDVSVDYIRNMINDPQWVNRLKGYELISDCICNDGDISHLNCIEFALVGLQDSHQKIMIEVTKLLNNLLSKDKGIQMVTSSVAELLAILFVKLTDSRALIRDAASSLINVLKTVIDCEVLLDACMKVLASIPEGARIPALQFYCSLLPSAKQIFSQAKHIREAIAKISWLTSSKDNNRSGTALTLSIKKILSFLWEYNAEIVCREIMKLSFHQQTVMKSYLRATAIDCEAVFLKYSKTLQPMEKDIATATISSRGFNSTADMPEKVVLSVPDLPVPAPVISRREPSLEEFLDNLAHNDVEVQKLPKLVSELQVLLGKQQVDEFLTLVSKVDLAKNGKLRDILVLKGLSINLSKASLPAIYSHLNTILALCFHYIDDANMIFRQASLLTLVELYIILRNEILPHMGHLTSAQRKLLLIYAEKRGAELAAKQPIMSHDNLKQYNHHS